MPVTPISATVLSAQEGNIMGSTHENSSTGSKIIERMQVPGWPHFYVLGCFESRVTFYNRQNRALNLIHAIRKLALPNDSKIAIVGTGASGLTAAAAAAIWGRRNGRSHGYEITVLDDRPAILALIGHGSARWLHP